eukprot:TRINITY_DN9254_c1_g1_i1.p1 TRINITY_DN9254_c1_g1~~TRINITY_DN9254_c1_g1_i1.p1  ORF type:complete len:332 (+),score=52.16 TRINITY_DN9254_c1_g1_i1:67-1062(+)
MTEKTKEVSKASNAKADSKREKPSAAELKESAEGQAIFEKLRPKRRWIFFFLYVCFCLWIMLFSSPCDVNHNRKRDCGFPGISPAFCATLSCFSNRGGKQPKKDLKIEVKAGETLGLEGRPDPIVKGAPDPFGTKEWVYITSIGNGAVRRYNAAQENETDIVEVGDSIAKVDSSGSSKGILTALSKKGSKTVKIELRKSKLPSYLRWVKSTAAPGRLEVILTAPLFKRWSKLTSKLGAVGLGCWLLSGYGVASIPTYWGISAIVSYYLTRCCHDSETPPNVPHCFQPEKSTPQEVVQQAWVGTQAFGARVVKHVTSAWKDVKKTLGEKSKR